MMLKRRRGNPGTYTASEVAENMGLHQNTVLWNIRQGYLKATFDGYRYNIRPQDVRAWVEEFYKGDDEY